MRVLSGAYRSVPDGNTLASGSLDGTVRLWEVATGAHIRALTGHTNGVDSVLWEGTTGALPSTLREHTRGVWSVSFSPDGSTLASGSQDNTARIWDTQTGTLIRILTGHTHFVSRVVFSPDGKHPCQWESRRHNPSCGELAPAVEPPPPEYSWSIPAGISLIHVPLKVTAVDGVAKTITSIADLYDVLGGADVVNFLVTLDLRNPTVVPAISALLIKGAPPTKR